MNWKKYILWSD